MKKESSDKFAKIVSFLMAEAMQNLSSLTSGKTPARSFRVEMIASDLKTISNKKLSDEEIDIILDKIINNISELG